MKQPGERVVIPVSQVEFRIGGNTIWVHSQDGTSTVLRIKTMGRISVEDCLANPVSHADMVVREDIKMCLSEDAES